MDSLSHPLTHSLMHALTHARFTDTHRAINDTAFKTNKNDEREYQEEVQVLWIEEEEIKCHFKRG